MSCGINIAHDLRVTEHDDGTFTFSGTDSKDEVLKYAKVALDRARENYEMLERIVQHFGNVPRAKFTDG